MERDLVGCSLSIRGCGWQKDKIEIYDQYMTVAADCEQLNGPEHAKRWSGSHKVIGT